TPSVIFLARYVTHRYRHSFPTRRSSDLSEKLTYDVTTSEQISMLHQKGESESAPVTTEIKIDDNVKPPIEQGEQVGTLLIKKENDIIIESPLVLKEEVEVASYFDLVKRSLKNIAKYKTS